MESLFGGSPRWYSMFVLCLLSTTTVVRMLMDRQPGEAIETQSTQYYVDDDDGVTAVAPGKGLEVNTCTYVCTRGRIASTRAN